MLLGGSSVKASNSFDSRLRRELEPLRELPELEPFFDFLRPLPSLRWLFLCFRFLGHVPAPAPDSFTASMSADDLPLLTSVHCRVI